MNSRPRAVVTGIGLRSPIGHTLDELVAALQNKRSGVVRMSEWEAVGHLRSKVAGICSGVDEKDVPRMYRRTMGRVAILSELAARDAIADSGLSEGQLEAAECGISFASTIGSTSALHEFMMPIVNSMSIRGIPSSQYIKFMNHTAATNLAMIHRLRGPLISSSTACTSGSQGIGFGMDQIRLGRAKAMLVGGAEEMHFTHAGIFDLLMATSTRYNDNPQATPRPFDAERDGLVVGEGAGCLMLEEYEHARGRGARIYCEVLGFGTNCDASHMTNPEAAGMAGAIRAALRDARLAPDEIEHVNAHATATVNGDAAEAQATHDVLGPRVLISGLKGYMGHTLGAAGALESIASIGMLDRDFIAPTRNLDTPDPAIAPLNHVIGDALDLRVRIVMNNNFAFGGVNTSLIFGRL